MYRITTERFISLNPPDRHVLSLLASTSLGVNAQREATGVSRELHIARHDNRIVGFAISERDDMPEESTALLHKIAVAPDKQNLGIGKNLLEELSSHKSLNSILVHPRDEVARTFFVENGFQPSSKHVTLLEKKL